MIKVLSRTVLHLKSGTSDKVYVVERLERGGGQATFTSHGRNGGTLKTNHVPASEAAKLEAEKFVKGYRPKAGTEGLTAAEADMSTPLSQISVVDPILPRATAAVSIAPAASAAPVAPVVVDPPKPEVMDLDALEAAFADIVKAGVHAGRIEPSVIKPNPDGTFAVQGTNSYLVTLNPMTCGCPAFKGCSPAPCKHIEAVVTFHGPEWIRTARAMALAADFKIPVAAPAPAPEVALEPDPIAAIFAPHVREGEEHPLVPLPEKLRWNPSHAKRIAAGFKRRKPVLLYGPTGTGKTSMVRSFAAMTNRPMVRINMTPQTTPMDLIGKWIVSGPGTMTFVEGPVTQAARMGYILVIDEVDRGDSANSAALLPVMEEIAALTLKEKDGEVVLPHPDFQVFLTANSLGLHDESGIYSGAQAADAALISRCGVQLYVGYHDHDTEVQILRDRSIPKKIAEKAVKAANAVRALIEKGTVVGAFGTRSAINLAENAVDLGSWEEAFEATAQAAFSRDEYKQLWETVQRLTGSSL